MVPMGRPPGQSSASSSTLWAQASKEWIIPARPKPGRKPKKASGDPGPPPAAPDDEGSDDDGNGRKSQNRAAQRAFRERKQTQLTELQTRLAQYEQGEVERNVQLQSIAKRLKDENDFLKTENVQLREEISRLIQVAAASLDDRKRPYDDVSTAPSPTDSLMIHTMRKRLKSRHSTDFSAGHLNPNYLPTPISAVSTPDSSSSSSAFSPMTYPSPASASYPTPGPSGTHGYSTTEKPLDQASPADIPDCGYCSGDGNCVCRGLGSRAPAQTCPEAVRRKDSESKSPSAEPDITPPARQPPAPAPAPAPAPSSILDNLPPYQPAVPLPRRPPTAAAHDRVFPYTTVEAPLCTGDPSNCLACADDPFGKAFCSALGEAVCANPACTDCPERKRAQTAAAIVAAPLPRSFAGGPACGHGPNCTCTSASGSSTPAEPSKLIPTNCAWQRIRAHPNSAFADLRLLAEVVAGRKRCTGPRISLTPPPPDERPARSRHASYSDSYGMLECGRQPVLEVQSADVREALAMLDRNFPNR